MKQLKNLLFAFLIAIVIVLSLGINANANELSVKNLYNTSNFNLNGEHLNLIINSIDKNTDVLVINCYMINSSSKDINDLKNFKLEIIESNGITILDDTFPIIDLPHELKPNDGVRVILYSNLDGSIDFDQINTENINYSYTYDYA